MVKRFSGRGHPEPLGSGLELFTFGAGQVYGRDRADALFRLKKSLAYARKKRGY